MELIRLLVVDVAVTLGGLIVGIVTLGMDVSSKEEVYHVLVLDDG